MELKRRLGGSSHVPLPIFHPKVSSVRNQHPNLTLELVENKAWRYIIIVLWHLQLFAVYIHDRWCDCQCCKRHCAPHTLHNNPARGVCSEDSGQVAPMQFSIWRRDTKRDFHWRASWVDSLGHTLLLIIEQVSIIGKVGASCWLTAYAPTWNESERTYL